MFRKIKRAVERRRAEKAAKRAPKPVIIKKIEPSAEELEERQEKSKWDNFYGCTEDGRLAGGMVFMDMRSIGFAYKPVEKKYILIDIETLKEVVTMWKLVCAWRGTGKSEWETVMAFNLVYPLRQAWKAGERQADITKLFQLELIALPTGQDGEKCIEKDGTVYRVFDQDDVKGKVMPFFTIQSEKCDVVYLTLNIAK